MQSEVKEETAPMVERSRRLFTKEEQLNTCWNTLLLSLISFIAHLKLSYLYSLGAVFTHKIIKLSFLFMDCLKFDHFVQMSKLLLEIDLWLWLSTSHLY